MSNFDLPQPRLPHAEEIGWEDIDASDYMSYLDKKLFKHDWYTFWGEVDENSCALFGNFLLLSILKQKPVVNIFMMSGGGCSDATRGLLAIMELAKQSGVIIRAYGAGLIGSAAFDIFTACSPGYRFAFEATMFMQHSSSGHVEDADMYDLQKRFDKWTLSKYTNIHPATIRKFLKTGNWWFDPKQALGYGVCDAIVKTGETLPEGPIFPKRKSAEQQKEEARKDFDNDDTDSDEE